ncbi:MAG: hypothetical protein WC657_08440, partial [Candidatus Paceibacterota bacterium]
VFYKYILREDHWFRTRIKGHRVSTQFIELYEDGRCLVRKGYCWDGCSGPTWDDDTNMVPGLHHDIKYQLIRLGLIPQICRGIADAELKEECIERGMWRVRAWYYFEGVDHFARYAAKYGTEPKILEAA